MSSVFSQDTIVDYSKHTVRIADTSRKYEIIYQFKDDFRIKHGKFKYDYFLHDQQYTIVRYYKYGKPHGKLTAKCDEQLTEINHHKNGQLNGKLKKYVDGEIILKGNYKIGIKKGRWTYLNREAIGEEEILEKGRFSGKKISLQILDKTLFKITFNDGTSMELERFKDKSLIDYLCNLYSINLIKNGDEYLKIGTWKYYKKGKLIKKVKFLSNGTVDNVINYRI